MIAVDTNILVYAHRTDTPFHAGAAKRIIGLAEGTVAWALPWPCVHEFLAIVTNLRIYDPPTAIPIALQYLDALFQSPRLILIGETELHWKTLKPLISAGRITGGRMHDARIAAICLEHNVREFWSADRDFSRFPALTVVNPLMS